MLYGIPSHHYIATAASTTEDDDLQSKVLLHRVRVESEATSIAKVKPVEGVLSEEEEKEVDSSPNTNRIKPLLVSNHGAGYDAAMQRKLDGSVTGLICSDDTLWRYDGTISKHCGHVYMNPSRHCSKVSAEGVPASEACPIACGDLRTKPCDIPECMDDSWFFWLPKRDGKWKVCNDFLWQDVKGRCRSLGVTALGDDPKFFAYEYCSKCSGYGNACVLTTSPTSSLTSSPTSSPTSNPTEHSYDTFVTTDELKGAVSDYCANPEEWTTNSKHAKYGYVML